MDGQSAWGQIAWAPLPGARLTARASWFQTTETIAGVTSLMPSNDVGLTVNGTVGLYKWLSLRGSIMIRAGLDDGAASIPFGAVANVFLVGTY